VIVAGNGGVKQAATHSVVAAGYPFLSYLDQNASELGFEWIENSALTVVGELRDNFSRPLLVGHTNPPLTHGAEDKLQTALFSLRIK
jgi:hypothetical protein